VPDREHGVSFHRTRATAGLDPNLGRGRLQVFKNPSNFAQRSIKSAAMNDRLPEYAATAQRLSLGDFVLDLEVGELLTPDGRLAGLRRQALDVLLVLGSRPGQVVTKDELMRRIWPDVVVGDGSLAQAITEIRRMLGDQAHQIVRNVSRRGYLLMPADRGGSAAEKVSSPAPQPPPVSPSTTPATRMSRLPRPALSGALAVAVLALLVLATSAAWLAHSGRTQAWLTPASANRPPLPEHAPALSIAVLPLTVEGAPGDFHWMADALHGDLITELGRSPDTWLIARDTMAAFKGQASDPRRVARELGVRHVVHGSLRLEAEQIRLNVALVDGETGVQRWADTFVTSRAALPQSLGELSMRIERVLLPEMFRAGSARRAALSPEQVGADDLAMRGIALWHRGLSRDNVLQGLAMLDRAVALDPGSIRAWGGISAMTIHGLLNGWLPDRAAAAMRLAEVTARLEHLDREGQATYNVKTINAFMAGDVGAMLQVTSAWTERHRTSWALGAHGFALMVNGRFDESAKALDLALRLSPRDTLRAEWQYRLAMAHFGAGRLSLAHEWGRAAALVNPGLRWPPVQVAALWAMGERDAARQGMAEFVARHGVITAEQLRRRLPGDEPKFAAARERLAKALVAAAENETQR
jgi:TolB-like protein/DNA-binding winged helix-turn-helix (wHTH) protein